MATGRFPPWFLPQDGVEEDGHMHVVYALDISRNVLKAALASMVSLSRHFSEPSSLTIHVIGDTVDVLEQELVTCFFKVMGNQATPHVQLHEIHTVPDVMLKYARRTLRPQDDANTDAFMRSASLQMTRFYLHQYLPPSASRALWLDADTLVMTDIMPLYQFNMVHAVAAVPDGAGLDDETLFLQQVSTNFSEAQSFIPAPGAHHFKTSVMLVDIHRWRQRQLHLDLEELAGLVHEHSTVDQMLLNLGLHSQFDELNGRWMLGCRQRKQQFREKHVWILFPSFAARISTGYLIP
ncbi:GATL4 [Symbiodinium natans]|uniref:GATL4 protein n=1 Tax=Symbiodinium natans TaxID=878477 RepID=A0A812RG94_9DINO|nr:GATL4 [Symbiodinium natans]